MRLLCGDIGGTKTLIHLVDVIGGKYLSLYEKRYASNEFSEFELILTDFLSGAGKEISTSIAATCFGVAGPVIDSGPTQTSRITNLPWLMDSSHIAARFHLPHVALINDFQAVGHGIDALDSSDLVTLQEGAASERGNQLVIGAGTGLGVAHRFWSGDTYNIIATEGGHSEFAPADDLQLQLAGFLLHRLGRNSIEYVLSGPGLVNVYWFICEQQQQLESDEYISIMQTEDPAAAITALADEDQNSIAWQALKLFVQVYGGQAGNFALSCMALGGVYIAGGIAPRIMPHLKSGEFIQAFNAKGKMADLMRQIPVRVINHPNVGLLGSCVYAENLAKQ